MTAAIKYKNSSVLSVHEKSKAQGNISGRHVTLETQLAEHADLLTSFKSLKFEEGKTKCEKGIFVVNGKLKIEFLNHRIASLKYKGKKIAHLPIKMEPACRGALHEAYKASSEYRIVDKKLCITIIKEGISEIPEWHLDQFCKGIGPYNYPETYVKFISDDQKGIEGTDTGGLSRELIDDIVKSLVKNPNYFLEVAEGIYLPCSSDKALFLNIGKLMQYCYASRNDSRDKFDQTSRTTGHYFSDALFRMALSLTQEDLSVPFEKMTRSTQIKLFRSFITEWKEDEMEYMKICGCLDLLEHKNTKDIELKFLNTAAYAAGYVDQDNYGTDFARIDKNPEAFIEDLYQALFNTVVFHADKLKGTPINKIMASIHALAQGLNGLTNVTAEEASIKIQGSINRAEILKSISFNGINKQYAWLTNWLKKTATDSEIKQFLKFVTGASSLPKGRIIQVDSLNNEIPYPRAFSCSYKLELSTLIKTEVQFIQNLKEAISVSSYQIL